MDQEDNGPETIILQSNDGHQFVIDKNAAMLSGTIRSMLTTAGERGACRSQRCSLRLSAVFRC